MCDKSHRKRWMISETWNLWTFGSCGRQYSERDARQYSEVSLSVGDACQRADHQRREGKPTRGSRRARGKEGKM
jgi:hypothetical protein